MQQYIEAYFYRPKLVWRKRTSAVAVNPFLSHVYACLHSADPFPFPWVRMPIIIKLGEYFFFFEKEIVIELIFLEAITKGTSRKYI